MTAPALIIADANQPTNAPKKLSDLISNTTSYAAELRERNDYFTVLYNEQQARLDTQEKTEIKILVKHGEKHHDTFGLANVTSPLDVARASPFKDILTDAVVARVIFYIDASMEKAMMNLTPNSDIEDETEKLQTDTGDYETLWDLTRPLTHHSKVEIIKFVDPIGKHVFWHSSSHLLGAALEGLYKAHLTIGPPLEKGFYYDAFIENGVTISSECYGDIEKYLQSLVKKDEPFQRLNLTKEQALKMFKGNPFKKALIESKVQEDALTSCYRCGSLIDLCRGPHVISTGKVRAIAVEKHSGAFWLGNTANDKLQRIYGISFPDEQRLKKHKQLMEEARKRDHRVLGNELNYFFFDSRMSPGSCFWLPDGAKIYNRLIDCMREEYRVRGYHEVITPNMFSCDLYKVSGHLQNYKENMYCLDVESQEWALKPMNCPGHCLIFRQIRPSYRQLPLRLADFGILHRNEVSGSLAGLTRVRRFQQDDAHIFCRFDQLEREVFSAIEFVLFIYSQFDFQYELQLSTRPKKAMGDLDTWNRAETALKQALVRSGKPWSLNPGDGAFYGPKIDIRLRDAAERWHQCGTIQLDFQLPIRFNLQYRTSEAAADAECLQDNIFHQDGSLEETVKPGYDRPIIIHRAILGSVERMIAILLEHTAGKLPFWLSPRQIYICPVSSQYLEYAQYIFSLFDARGYDVHLDSSSTTLNKKVRNARIARWNYLVVVGAVEQDKLTVVITDVRTQEKLELPIKDSLNFFHNFAKFPTSTSSQTLDNIPPFTPSKATDTSITPS